MVDFDQKVNSRKQTAGLKRFSARAAAPAGTGGRKVFFSFAAYARTAIDQLRKCRVHIEKGLSDEELARVEAAYGFSFPPDLRAILQEGLPTGVGFPNWRHGSAKQLQMRFDLPTAGLLYEVARGSLWWKQWGPRPVGPDQAVRLALLSLRKAPILIPVYSHCYIPSTPNLAGNPVFFVYRKEVFVSGIDMADFYQRTTFAPHDYHPPTKLPDFLDWVEDGGGRIVRMGSGRDLLKDRVRMVSGKENVAATPSSRAGDDENSQQQHRQEEDDARAWHLPEATNVENGDDGGARLDHLPERDVESWGRNLDALVAKHAKVKFRSLDNFGRRVSASCIEYNGNGSVESKAQQEQQQQQQQQQQRQRLGDLSRVAAAAAAAAVAANGRPPAAPVSKTQSGATVMRFSYFEETPLSSRTLLQFSLSAPPWAAKAARRVEFWSEMADKRPVTGAGGQAPETLFSAHKVDCDVANLSQSLLVWENAPPAKKESSLMEFKSAFQPKWMVSYLDDISLRLRNAGWKEDDIEDIMETSSPAPKQLPPQMESKQSALDALSTQAELLSSLLRDAGWSMRDVTEVLNVDVGHRRTTSKLSPELVARLSTFAEYVVNA